MTAATRVLEHLRSNTGEIEALLGRLVELESPTDVPASHDPVRALLVEAWAAAGSRARRFRGRGWGDGLLFVPESRRRARPYQLLVGHFDTVWPLGTLERMPLRHDAARMHGPGVFDMKAGLVQMIFAVRALRELGLTPPADPVAFINADEEVGSPGSRGRLRRLARGAVRAWVLEPAMGARGDLKTARKGVARFTVRIEGRASHAGLAPDEGISAIVELAEVIRTLESWNDAARGVTVNTGVVRGGTRANVVAAEAEADIDVRVLTLDDGDRIEQAIRALEPTRAGLTIEVSGGFEHPPMERSARNRALWHRARSIGAELGLDLDHGTAGGASDGNVTSRYTATLDGLGAVGDGAHADHEHILRASLPERTALLAALLLTPVDSPVPGSGSAS